MLQFSFMRVIVHWFTVLLCVSTTLRVQGFLRVSLFGFFYVCFVGFFMCVSDRYF